MKKSKIYTTLILLIIAIFGLVMLFTGCQKTKFDTHYNKDWKTYTVDSGNKFSSPRFFRIYRSNRVDTGCLMTGEQMVYDLGTYNQWNKVRGFKYDSREVNGYPRKGSMVAWRYMNEYKDSIVYDTLKRPIDTIKINLSHFQFAPYFNNYPNDPILFPDSNDILKVDSGIVHWTLEYIKPNASVKIWQGLDTVKKTIKIGNFNLYTSIGFYFGGAKAAPNKIQTKIKD